jgi:hypothetical protein
MRAMRFLLLLLVAGCSHVSIETNTNTSSSTVVSGQAGLHVESRALAAMIIAGMFIAAAVEDARHPRPYPTFSDFADWFRGTPKAEMDRSRPVQEQDCTRPVELAGNLKCR